MFIERFPISTDDALVVVSELLSNAVRHGAEPIALRHGWEGRTLRIEVSDGDPSNVLVTPTASSSNTNGRGLALTDSLAASWGVHEAPFGRGKTVWATISSEARPS
jgi:anti-sigma regulatory factor (Ser/Thr protein kinase)